MGCGGSKTDDAKEPKGKDWKDGQKGTPRHRKRSKTTQSTQGTPQRREPKQKKAYVPKRRESEPNSTLFQRSVPFEGENLTLTGNWELETAVDEDTPLTETNYPVCKVSKTHHSTDKTDYHRIDKLGMQVNPRTTSFTDLARDIISVQDHLQDLEKVRLFVIWMCMQRIRTRQYGADAKEGTPLGYMKRMKEGKATFAGLLAQLCRAINIPCVIIKGYCKTALHLVGMDDVRENKCTWNAVHVDGQWQIMHPFFICTPASQQSPTEGWTLVESSVDERPQNKDNHATFNGFFFAPRPSDFIHICYPEEHMHNWQLLEKKLSYSEFIYLPFLRSVFYGRHFLLLSDAKCALKTDNGHYIIRIRGHEHNLKDTVLKYDLYSSDADFKMEEEWGDLVFCGRTEDTWNIQVRCYAVGVYKLALYGLSEGWFYWLADFKITCDHPMEDIQRPPSIRKNEPLGPTSRTETAGLLCASHQGGIVFYKQNEQHVIKFLLNRRVRAECEIAGVGRSAEELSQHVKKKIHGNEMDFVFNLPYTGEFLLKIFVVDETDERVQVCIYWLTDADNTKARENVFQRKARINLREATSGSDLEVLEIAIEKFQKSRLSEADDDFLRAQRRLKYLKLKKGLRDGLLRRHEEILDNAIFDAENSDFREALKPSLDRCRALQEDISKLEMYCHPVLEMNQTTVSELANFANPPQDVHSIMKATYLLLGEEMKTLKQWGNIQGLLRRTGRESIKHRVKDFQEQGGQVDNHVEKQVEHILKEMPKSYALSASLSAATFYEWVKNVSSMSDRKSEVSNVLDGHKEMTNKSKNADDSLQSDDDDDFKDENRIKHNRYQFEFKQGGKEEETFQDEGFLDSYDLEHAKNDDLQTCLLYNTEYNIVMITIILKTCI